MVRPWFQRGYSVEVGIATQLTRCGCWDTLELAREREGHACHQEGGPSFVWAPPCLGILNSQAPLCLQAQERPLHLKEIQGPRAGKAFISDRITEVRDRVSRWGTGPSSGSAGLEPRSSSPDKTPSKAPSAQPAGPSLLLLLSLDSPPGIPPSPGSQEQGDLGPHLPGLVPAAKSREQAGICRGLNNLWLWPNFRFRAGGAEWKELLRREDSWLTFGAATIPTGPKPRGPTAGEVGGAGSASPAFPNQLSLPAPHRDSHECAAQGSPALLS